MKTNRLGALLLSLALVAAPASAASVAGDQNDWWFTPGEGGWAINVAHQADTVFIAWYLYAPNGNPVWYSGDGVLTGSPANPVFTGRLYASTGPWFGAGSYNENAVARREVGTFTFNPSAQNQAALTYSVDGVPVTKTLQRFLFKYNNLSGSYVASVSQWGTGCGASEDGPQTDDLNLQITHNANNSIVIVSGSAPDICTLTATYSQGGRLGALSGTMICPEGPPISYTMTEIDVTTAGITGRIVGQVGTCRVTGNLAAARRVTGP